MERMGSVDGKRRRQLSRRGAELRPRLPASGSIKPFYVEPAGLLAQPPAPARGTPVAPTNEERCFRCGKTIPKDAEAHIWNSESIVCGPCIAHLQHDRYLSATPNTFAGFARGAWYVDNGMQKLGPYDTHQLIEMLHSGRVDFQFLIWRDGMSAWRKASQLFTIPELNYGQIELRDHGQGDGTYRPV